MSGEAASGGVWRARIGLLLGPIFLLVSLVMPGPAGLSVVGWRLAGVALLMATWWITEAIPIPATALIPLVVFPLLGIAPIAGTAAPYADSVIFLFLGGFLLAAALQRCGLHRRLALAIIHRGGTRPANLVGGFMVATAFLSMWVSNTATVAMMLPMALSVLAVVEGRARQAGADRGAPGTSIGGVTAHRSPSQANDQFATSLLLGLAYAASIGGMGTLIGTPPNALLAGFMAESYGVQIGFAQWLVVGLPLVVVALPLVWLLLTRVLHPTGDQGLVGGAAAIEAERQALGPPSRAEWTVGVITLLTAGAWVFRPLLAKLVPGISDAGIAITGALLFFLAPVGRGQRALDWEAAHEVPWGVLLLFGGGLSLASAIQHVGLANWLGDTLAAVAGWPMILVIVCVATLIVFLTELTSNTATAATFLPVAGSLAVAIGAAPVALAVPTALGASCAFMMPVATPPNAIVYGSDRLTIPQMARAGFIINLMMIVFVSLAARFLAPLLFGTG